MVRPPLALAVAFALAALSAVPVHAQDLPAPPALPVVEDRGDHVAVEARVPLGPGMAGQAAGQLDLPVDAGVVDVVVEAVPMAGPGGAVDAETYVAQARLLLPDGVSIPLPSLVVRAEDSPLDGPAADALAGLADAAAAAQAAADALADEMGAAADAANADTQAEADGLQAQALALAAEAEWVDALAAEAAGHATSGAERQAAIANALLAHAEAGLALMAEAAGHFGSMLPGVPGVPPAVQARLDAAQARIAEAQARADGARQALEDQAGAAVVRVDGLVDEQAAIDGARVAVEAALADMGERGEEGQDGAGDRLEGVFARIDALQAAAADAAARQADRRQVREAAAAAQEAIEDARAEAQWAIDWSGAVSGWASTGLDAAQESLREASATLAAMEETIQSYAAAELLPAADPALAGLDAAAQQADAALRDAQAALADALGALGRDLAGGLDPADPGAGGDFPGNQILVCRDEHVAACVAYEAPGGPEPRALVVQVLVPVPGSLPGVPGAPGVPGGVPVPGAPLPGVPGGSTTTTSPAPPANQAPASSFDIETAPATLSLREGQQQVLRVTVRNTGGADDTVRLGLEVEGPLAADGPGGAIAVPAGQSATFDLRLTPTGPGAGTLRIVADGDNGAKRLAMPFQVAAAPAGDPPPQSRLMVTIDPASVRAAAGQGVLVTVQVRNDATVADDVHVTAQGDGLAAEPAAFDLHLKPGETVDRQVRLSAAAPGSHELRLRVASAHGADLQPVLLLDAFPMVPDAGPAQDPAPDQGTSNAAPGLEMALAAVALALVAARRRRA